MLLVASPAYLQQYGTPTTAAELEGHRRIDFSGNPPVEGWTFDAGGKRLCVMPPLSIQASDGESIRQLALRGFGIAKVTEFTVKEDVRAGRLVPLLQSQMVMEEEVFQAVFVGKGGPTPKRVRVLLDFLAENCSVS